MLDEDGSGTGDGDSRPGAPALLLSASVGITMVFAPALGMSGWW
jgi:hypothetical protein